jgi:FixJ family two-component response regulator
MPSAVTPNPSKTELPRVLVVDDEPSLREVIEDILQHGIECHVFTAGSVAEAKKILLSESIQLLIADVNLPDGNGTSLLALLQRHQPTATAIVITGHPSMDIAINAMRDGAVDFVPKPFTHEHLVDRMRSALNHQAKADKQEKRFDRLKVAVKRLNESRRMISRKVDLLCNDLVSAYGELSKQLDDVRTQEGFRKFIAGATDLEQLLCHAMDWMLRQLGYCNVAVYLAGEDGAFQLGAYLKYTLTGDNPLTDSLKRVLLPPTVREGCLHVNANEYDTQFTSKEMLLMKGQDILGINCTYLGESLACILFFRDSRSPFTDDDEALLRSISSIFAIALASVVREIRGDEDQEDADRDPESSKEDGGVDNGPRPRKDPADWWKHGGESPY